MTDSEQLIKIIDFWKKTVHQADLVWRPVTDKIDYKSREVVDIIGPRRSGKSSILKLLIKKLKLTDFLFINFEDPYFVTNNKPQIIEELIAVYKEYFNKDLKYIFLDEVHTIDHWENAVRKLRDKGIYKIYVTGSSAKLLSRELSTLLTGRHLSYAISPLNFSEWLEFKKIRIKKVKDLVINQRLVLKNFEQYLKIGGFPEIVKTGNIALLKQYYLDTVQKDIIGRYEVRQKDILEKMGIFLLTNAGRTVSVASLKNTFNLSFEAVSTYISYFKEAFILYDVPQFAYSLKTQAKALKKIYAVDTGLINQVSFHFSEDKGRLLGQCVFNYLHNRSEEIFYYKTGNNQEVDFLVINKGKKQLIQVCWDLTDEDTKSREITGLKQAMGELKLNEGTIITFNDEEKLKFDGKIISIEPAYKWLLSF